VDGARRNEDECAWSDSFCGSGAGVEGVGTFKDVEGFCFIMGVRWVVEARVLPRLPDRLMTAGLGPGCFARDMRALATHWEDDAVSLGRPAQDYLGSLSFAHSRPPHLVHDMASHPKHRSGQLQT
jgi:hypothetical protein